MTFSSAMTLSSTASSVPSTTSCSSHFSSRSGLNRQLSFTHSFPANPSNPGTTRTVERQGLSVETRALAKRALSPNLEARGDKAVLFFGGLQWLLDSTVSIQADEKKNLVKEHERAMLTEDAVHRHQTMEIGRSQRAQKPGGRVEDRRSSASMTNAWVSDQMASD